MGANQSTPRPPRAWYDLLKRLRTEKGWRQTDVVEALKARGFRPRTVAGSFISRLERETVPSPDTLSALSQVYGVDLVTAYNQAVGLQPGGSPLASVQTEHGGDDMIIEGILAEITVTERAEFLREVLAISARYKRRTHRDREAKSKSGP